jgi:hypothetical protein
MRFFVAVRAVLLVAWLLSPPFLTFLALLIWKRARPAANWKTRLFIKIAPVILTNWILFLVLCVKAQTPYGAVFTTSPLTHALLFLACVSVVVSFWTFPVRWPLSLAGTSLITLWIVVAYAPAHWLKKVDFGTVRIDGRPTLASVYIGNATDSEADAIALVRVSGTGDYFLSFGEEKVRLSKEDEYVRLPGGIWSIRSIREMVFTEPLPFRQMNEFRIVSPKGSAVSIQF